MKKLSCFFLMLLISAASFAQVAVNIDGTEPDLSAMLDVKSTAKGFLAPRMTYTEMNSIVNPAQGLMVFCTTTGQYYFNKGTPALPNWVASFYLPFSGSFSSLTTLLDITNTGLGYLSTFIINNPASYASALYAETNGPGWTITSYNTGSTDGFAGYFRNTSPTNNWPAIQGKTAGTGPVFRAYQTLGPGGGLDVHMQYASSTAAGIAVYNDALGNACQFFLNNAASTASALHAENNGSGDVGFFQTNSSTGSNAAVKGRAINIGGCAGAFEIFNATNTNTALYSYTQGTGGAGSFNIDNTNNPSTALNVATNGGGSAIFALNSGSTNAVAAVFKNTNSANSYPAVQASTTGWGTAFRAMQDSGPGGGIDVYMNNSASTTEGVKVDHLGLGTAGTFNIYNSSSTAHALYTQTNGSGYAIYGVNSGTGNAGSFNITNTFNSQPALWAWTNGTGSAGGFKIENTSNGSAAVYAETVGTGNAGYFKINNTATTNSAIHAETNGNGNAGLFLINNVSSNNVAIWAETNGAGTALSSKSTGTGGAGNFSINNGSNSNSAVYAETNGTGVALYGKTTGTGNAGNFSINNTSSTNAALYAETNGNGNAGLFLINTESSIKT